jgi:acyl-CoA hydrolase
MYVDAFGEMAEAHKVNCSRKTIDRFRQVYAFAVGSKRLYEYLDDNPALMSVSVSYTNDITRISSIDHFMSINSAINVDLYGQVNAETAGFRHISGAGGQLDFVIGAFLSDGGKSFICCPSTFTDKEGKVHSSILSTMPQGTVMTDTRANTHYLVTEYGKVNLKGLSSWQRAEAIISVAHPDFRDELIREAEKMHIWRRSNKRS